MTIEIWKNYFDVVILPPVSVREHAIELSRKLKMEGGAFALGKRSYLPHISLYHIPVPRAYFSRFVKDVRAVASRSQRGSLRLRTIEFPLLMTDKPPWLRRLHLDIVKSTVQYFDWKYGVEELWNIDRIPPRFNPIARRNLKQFGSPMIGSAFRPHITLTSFKEKRAARNIRVDFTPMSFDVHEIVLCELGPHHSCQRVIEVFELGGR